MPTKLAVCSALVAAVIALGISVSARGAEKSIFGTLRDRASTVTAPAATPGVTSQPPRNEAYTAPPQQPTATEEELRCRGGKSAFNFHDTGTGTAEQLIVALSFTPIRGVAAGRDSASLAAGTCGLVERAFAELDPQQVQFRTAANSQLREALHGSAVDRSASAAERHPDAVTIPAYLESADHYWSFRVRRTNYGYFEAISHGPWQAALSRAVTNGSLTQAGTAAPTTTAPAGSVVDRKPAAEVMLPEEEELPPQPKGGRPAGEAEQRGIIIVGGRPVNEQASAAVLATNRPRPDLAGSRGSVRLPTQTQELSRLPTLTVSPSPFRIPYGSPSAQATIRWNAGAEIPSAILLVAANGGPEEELARGHDGAAQLAVQLQSFYRVRLVAEDDSQRELASASVAGEEGAPESILTRGSVGSAAATAAARVTEGFFREVRAVPHGDSVTFSFETTQPSEFFVEVSATAPNTTGASRIPPGQRLPPAFPEGSQLAAFTLPGTSGVSSRHEATVRGSGTGLESGVRYHYVITAKGPDGTFYRYLDRFSNARRAVKVVWEALHVIDDADDLGPGEGRFWLWANWGSANEQWIATNKFDIDTGETYSIDRYVILEDAARSIEISVSGREMEGGVGSFDPAGAPPAPVDPGGQAEGEVFNVALNSFDLTQSHDGQVIPFKLTPTRTGSGLRFEATGRIEVSFKGFQ
ncbi:MAG: hypothetical protein R3E86_14545 [Pseudomonadales bacterium]